MRLIQDDADDGEYYNYSYLISNTKEKRSGRNWEHKTHGSIEQFQR